jgi:hypothetical protein
VRLKKERKMKASLIAVTLGLLTLTSAVAEARVCSINYYASILTQANSLQGPLRRCDRQLKRRNINIISMCNVCGPTFRRVARQERELRNNRSCFAGDAKAQRAIRQLSSVRAELTFVRRGCGY